MFLSRIPVLSRCLLKGCSSWNPKAPMGLPRCVAIAKSWFSFDGLFSQFPFLLFRELGEQKTCNIRHPFESGWGYCTPNIICQSNYLRSLFLYFTMTLLVFLLPSARVFTMMLIPF